MKPACPTAAYYRRRKLEQPLSEIAIQLAFSHYGNGSDARAKLDRKTNEVAYMAK